MPGRILVVCEKPSVGRDIARVLGAKEKGEGFLQNESYVVSWGFGHLASPAMPEEIDPAWKKWQFDTLPMLPENIPLKILPASKKQYGVLKKLMLQKDIASIVCATDAGREGELIFRRIYALSGCKKPVQRLWISSMTDQAIREGFAALQPMAKYDNLYKSANCRAEADWLVGMNGSRAFTLRYNALLSVGRVQTPTLSLLVQRKKEIERFVPEDYFELRADFSAYRGLYVKDGSSRIQTREEAERIARAVRGGTGRIQSISREVKRLSPPLLYDLTTLQREANARYGLTAAKTLEAAQSLYETHKLLTYPRTDSRHLPDDQRPVVEKLLKKLPPELCSLLQADYQEPGRRVFDNDKISDHHAIIPTGRAPTKALSQAEQRVFDLVQRRLCAAFMGDYSYEQCQVYTQVSGHLFLSRGKTVLSLGWQKAAPPLASKKEKDDAEEETPLPALREGEEYPLKSTSIAKKQTRPPAQYTENTLLDAMEHAGRFVTDEALRAQLKERGLGTPATRAATLERLIEVGYVRRVRRTLLATEKGQKLIEAVPWQLSSPETTGRWEKGLKDIENGKMDPERFMQSIRRYSAYLVESAKSAPAINFPKDDPPPARKKRSAPRKAKNKGA